MFYLHNLGIVKGHSDVAIIVLAILVIVLSHLSQFLMFLLQCVVELWRFD